MSAASQDSSFAKIQVSSSVPSNQKLVTEIFRSAIVRAFPEVSAQNATPIIAVSNPKFGDYQCNNAMALFKTLKESCQLKSPKDAGERIKSALEEDEESRKAFSQITVAPQGFITVALSMTLLQGSLQRILVDGGITFCNRSPIKVAVDFSSPNIAKEMHVGHLRSTIIGESISRVLEFCQFDVERINHLGDWGTQFGMLIEYMKEAHPDFQTNPPPINELCDFYRKSKARFDSDPEFKTRARKMVVSLQSGDPFARAAWELICEISRKDFQAIYDRLQVTLHDRGESFYNDMLKPLVEKLRGDGFLEDSNGALCLFTSATAEEREKEVPFMVVKSDGGFGYDATDLAAAYHRLILTNHDWLIYVTDVGQAPHFQQLARAVEKIGWHQPPQKTRIDHVGLGLVCGDDGKKFKTRSGDTVKLTSLLDEAVSRARQELQNRDVETKPSDLPQEVETPGVSPSSLNAEIIGESLTLEQASERIGMAAIKYFDLKQSRTSNYVFSYDRMLDPKGNTAVYLLYSYARICSIFRRAKVSVSDIKPDELELVEPQERALAMSLLKFSDVVEAVLGDLFLHRISDLLYEISTVFTDFYQGCRIVGHEKERSRLLLCAITQRLMLQLFRLLDIEPLPKI